MAAKVRNNSFMAGCFPVFFVPCGRKRRAAKYFRPSETLKTTAGQRFSHHGVRLCSGEMKKSWSEVTLYSFISRNFAE
ncbi:MAG: hypothetical protein II600_02865, partial [Bacteroidaceae bacterium]|nr:hypothetical protein [Bacteroidaceae bacterium]